MKRAAAAASVMLMILIFPQASVDGARNAMSVWYRSVAPALFPFFVLMPMLTGDEACAACERMLSGVMNKVFRLPGAAAPAMLVGMLSGSPAGALAITRVAAGGRLGKTEVRRLAMAVCGLSPSFLILGIGQEMYGSIQFGWRLACVQLAVQILILFLTRGMKFHDEDLRIETVESREGIRAAVENILAVCGYMVLFGAISAVLAAIVGKRAGELFLLLLDLPGGSAALSKTEVRGKLLLQLAATGFAGVCIALQNMDALGKAKVTWKQYLAGRCMSMILFVIIGGGFAGVFSAENAVKYEKENVNIYAVSLLTACLGLIPWIYSVRRTYFLTKENFEKQE